MAAVARQKVRGRARRCGGNDRGEAAAMMMMIGDAVATRRGRGVAAAARQKARGRARRRSGNAAW